MQSILTPSNINPSIRHRMKSPIKDRETKGRKPQNQIEKYAEKKEKEESKVERKKERKERGKRGDETPQQITNYIGHAALSWNDAIFSTALGNLRFPLSHKLACCLVKHRDETWKH